MKKKIVKKQKYFDVPVSVNIDVNIYVKANSAQEAEDKVCRMTRHDILAFPGNCPCYDVDIADIEDIVECDDDEIAFMAKEKIKPLK